MISLFCDVRVASKICSKVFKWAKIILVPTFQTKIVYNRVPSSIEMRSIMRFDCSAYGTNFILISWYYCTYEIEASVIFIYNPVAINMQCSDQCTGMIIENYLSTDATYPIVYGTAITVDCDPQYSMMGSKVITCEKGIVYTHQSSRPKCVDPGKYWSAEKQKINSL